MAYLVTSKYMNNTQLNFTQQICAKYVLGLLEIIRKHRVNLVDRNEAYTHEKLLGKTK